MLLRLLLTVCAITGVALLGCSSRIPDTIAGKSTSSLTPGDLRETGDQVDLAEHPVDGDAADDDTHPGIQLYRAKYQGTALSPEEVRTLFPGKANGSSATLQELSLLLSHSQPDVRKDAAYLLGYLKDVAARGMLSEAIDDADELVRVAVCTALGWIKPGEVAEPSLTMMCRDDPSVEVRVAAAEALGRDDDDAIAAYRLGLVGKNEWLREKCEIVLERLGKLELPLPEEVYGPVSRQDYERWLAAGKVERHVTKAGTIYFEIVEVVGMRPPPGAICAIGSKRYWYSTPAN
jgi:hypothetical protein